METTKRKLSELIREGAKLRPQCRENFFDTRDGELCSCALGAAIEAIGYEADTEKWNSDAIVSLIENQTGVDIDDTMIKFLDGNRGSVGELIVIANDDNGMTREAIADWLESEGY